jgi:hypothetical protein
MGAQSWASDAPLEAGSGDGVVSPGVGLHIHTGRLSFTAGDESREEEQRESTRSDREPSGGDSGAAAERARDLGEAVRLAEHLTVALRVLEERERSAYRLDQETMERIRRLEQGAQTIAAVHHALQEQVQVEIDDAELAVVESLLGAWVDRPNDLLVMVKLAERSTALASIVSAFREIRRLVDSAGETPAVGE